jgi:RNA polymerase sigma-70 factor (ECF subfamily)
VWITPTENQRHASAALGGIRARKKPLYELDEEHLVKCVARGDHNALEELYRRTSTRPATRLRRR